MSKGHLGLLELIQEETKDQFFNSGDDSVKLWYDIGRKINAKYVMVCTEDNYVYPVFVYEEDINKAKERWDSEYILTYDMSLSWIDNQ